MHGQSNARGFTLIELMVTLAVLSVLMVLAVPTFSDFRQRAVIRGAADQVVSFWGDARFEALRRNQFVKVGVVRDSAKGICLGAATTTLPGDETPCDCFTAAACNVSQYPQNQSEWRGVRMPSEPTLGNTAGALKHVAVIDPKRANITNMDTSNVNFADDTGQIPLQSPPGSSLDFRLSVNIDRNGRAVICEPSAAPSKLSQYADRRCD